MFSGNHFRDFSGYRQDTLRLQNHDYSGKGAYHVIICAKGIDGRAPLFAHPALYLMLQTHWHDLTRQFPCLYLDTIVIMPNHLHLILWPFMWPDSAPEKGPAALGAIIGAYKSTVSYDWRHYIDASHPNWSAKLWQHNYWERYIRIDEMETTRLYIHNNPLVSDEIYKEMDWEKPLDQDFTLDPKKWGKICVADLLPQSNPTP